ncbi:MAG TPA: hypothetical protein VI815_00750 [Candidatus Nanoarchaeia archaeon]|nr:hypothetical protein [Candidatus Nanoarchaeia archaeon]
MLATKIRTSFNHMLGDGRAFLDDPRFYDPRKNYKLEKFLPNGFDIISGPINLNPWTFALGLDEDVEIEDVERILGEDYVKSIISSYTLANNTGVMVYDYVSPDPDCGASLGFAGQYIGDGRVRSLYKKGACILEHHWDVNPLNFHLNELDRILFWSPKLYVKKD